MSELKFPTAKPSEQTATSVSKPASMDEQEWKIRIELAA